MRIAIKSPFVQYLLAHSDAVPRHGDVSVVSTFGLKCCIRLVVVTNEIAL